VAAWEPPLSPEERLKALLVPARVQLLWELWRARAREPELALIPRLAQPGRIAIDAGANRGVWAEAMRPHVAAVHAFEPNPKMARLLRAGAAPGVVAHAIALSDGDGEAVLRIPRGARGFSNQGASLAEARVAGRAFATLRVAARPLDALGLGPVGLIKIDVEGHELAVIEGARRTLARDRPALVVEIEERHCGLPLPRAIAAIAAHGYRGFALLAGALTPVGRIDLAACQAPGAPRGAYLFNWVFLPEEAAPGG
jgi:FkbM family methyltransferase